MRVQQKNHSNPSFGMKIINTKSFSQYAAKQGWQDELQDIFQKLEAKFPQDKRTFEISPNCILAEEKGDVLGTTYEFAGKNTNFKSPEEIKKAIIKTVAGHRAMKSIPEYVKRLNEKFGVAIDFNPRNISSVAGNNSRNVAKALHGVAKALCETKNKEQYGVRVYNDGSSSTLTLKISRREKQAVDCFMFMNNGKNQEERAKLSVNATIQHLQAEFKK